MEALNYKPQVHTHNAINAYSHFEYRVRVYSEALQTYKTYNVALHLKEYRPVLKQVV